MLDYHKKMDRNDHRIRHPVLCCTLILVYLNRKVLAELLNMTRDNMYHPKQNWTHLVQEHLNKSLGEEGLIRQFLLSKSASFISHPLPECSCRISSGEAPTRVRGGDGRVLYGGEEECPKWMKHDQDVIFSESLAEEEGKIEDIELLEYESNLVEQPESNNNGNTNASLIFEQDEEMDPND